MTFVESSVASLMEASKLHVLPGLVESAQIVVGLLQMQYTSFLKVRLSTQLGSIMLLQFP